MKKFIAFMFLCFSFTAFAEKMPMIIDTDMGMNDIMAITYILQNPNVKVEAILVDGNATVYCEQGVEGVLGLMEILNYPDVPVRCGRLKPLGESYEVAADVKEASTEEIKAAISTPWCS